MPAETPVCVDGIIAQRKKEQLLMKVLQQQAERLEEEKLQLKLEVSQWLKCCRVVNNTPSSHLRTNLLN
jgi:hypothetical protein